MNQIIFWKGLLASIKRHLCLTREHMDNLEGLVEVESPLIRSCFWQVWSKLRNLFFFFFFFFFFKFFLKFFKFFFFFFFFFFFRKSTLKEASDPWMLYLSIIGPDIFLEKQEFRQAGYQNSLMKWFSKFLLRA